MKYEEYFRNVYLVDYDINNGYVKCFDIRKNEKRIVEEKDFYKIFNQYNLIVSFDNKEENLNILSKMKNKEIKYNSTFCNVDLKNIISKNNKTVEEYAKEYNISVDEDKLDILNYLYNKTKESIQSHFNINEYYSNLNNENINIYQFNGSVSGIAKKLFTTDEKIENPKITLIEPRTPIAKDLYSKRNEDINARFNDIRVNDITIPVGIAGLHSSNDFGIHKDVVMLDITSNYPSIIAKYMKDSISNFNYDLYVEMLEKRIELKATDKELSTVYKMLLNSTTGIFNSPYSQELYQPNVYKAITTNAQIMMIDLIETISDNCELVQVNTDGLMVKNIKDKDKFKSDIENWMKYYQMDLKHKNIDTLIQKNVNDYVAKSNQEIITKGTTFYNYDNNKIHLNNDVVKYAITEKMLNNIDFKKSIESFPKEIKENKDDLLNKIDKEYKNTITIKNNAKNYEYSQYNNTKVELLDNSIIDNKNCNTKDSNINLADFLNYLGYEISGNGKQSYSLKEHNSLILRGNRFYWNSKNISGDIYTLMETLGNNKGITMKQIKNYLLDIRKFKYKPQFNYYDYSNKTQISSKEKEFNGSIKPKNEIKDVDLSKKKIITDYLCEERKLDSNFVDKLISKGYVDTDNKNILFTISDVLESKDLNNIVGYEVVGISKKFKRNTSNHNGFQLMKIDNDNVKVENMYVFESPIDLLSYYELNKDKIKDNSQLVSISGVREDIFKEYLTTDTKNIIIGTDNDEAGNNFFNRIKAKYGNKYNITRELSKEKDFNDDLKSIKKSKIISNEWIKEHKDNLER